MANTSEVAVKRSDTAKTPARTQTYENFTTPAADIVQTPDAFIVALEMPGATRESINVCIEGNNVIVKSALEQMHADNASLLFNEINKTGYYRAFTIGEGIDRNNVDAHYEDGILTLKLHKSEEMKPKEIPIR